MLDVFFLSIVVNKNIVQVDDAKIVWMLSKSFVNKDLKNIWRIAQFEEHYYVFK